MTTAQDIFNFLKTEGEPFVFAAKTKPSKIEVSKLRMPSNSEAESLVFTSRDDVHPITRPAVWVRPMPSTPPTISKEFSSEILSSTPKAVWVKIVWKFFRDKVVQCAMLPTKNLGAKIHPSAEIGSAGLGVVRDAKGKMLDVPHVGHVILHAGVRIGANSVIHRGVLSDTVIGPESRIGAMVNIGHGVIIGKDCLIAPMTTIGGSTTIGDGVTLWQGVKIANKIHIGSKAVVAMGSVVLRNIPSGETWGGVPARKIR